MAVKSQGQISIADLSDARQLSARLSANMPQGQIYDPNTGSYTPSWASTNLKVTPTIYIDHTPLPLNSSGLTITWKRRDGAAAETALVSGETVSGNILTVSANTLANASSGIITYLANISYLDPETKQTANIVAELYFALTKHALKAHDVSIDGEQVFKYDKSGALTGAAQITLNATATNVNITKWQYKKADGSFVDYITTSENANINGSTLIVKHTHEVFSNNVATIKVLTSDSNVTDIISIAKIYDGATGGTGAAGKDAYTVLLTNEAQVFAANVSGACSAFTATAKVIAYKGATKVTPTVATPTELPTGMTFSQSTANSEVTCSFVVAANATLGNADTGIINLTVTVDGKAFVKTFSWSKSKTGATGAAGQNAVVFSIYAPNGTYVQNGEGSILLDTAAYDGSTAITSGATYQWAKFVNGSYQNISGATAKSLTVKGEDVANIQTYRCTMTYKSKTYIDVITVEDKTDNFSVEIMSTGGNIFKNKQGESILTALVYANGNEVDALLAKNVGTTAPASPKNGDLWYKVDKTAKTVALMKYNGSAWVAATEKQAYTYKWYRLDKDGNALDTTTPFKTGKVIFINADDVNSKTTFLLELDDGK